MKALREKLYSVERTYPVSIETLWNAWVDPKALEVWYSPVQLEVAPGTVENEAVVGGIWAVGVDVPEYNFVAYFFGVYTNVIEHELLEHTMNYTQSLDEFKKRVSSPEEHLIQLQFKEVEGGSWVSFTQFGEMPEEQIELTRQGTSSYFDNLGKFLASK
jgi:uncharacterized protein YndB with AHSA1/START domain